MTTPSDFEALVARHQGAVCAIAYAVLRDRALSEEVAQEAFLVAWQKLPGMRPAPSLPGWVCGIARNLARNAARRRKETAMLEDAQHPTTTTVLDDLLDREASALANRALAKLSANEREAVVMYYRCDQAMPQIAEALGISEAAAKKRVLRGRDHLRTAMKDVEATLRTTRPGPAFTAGCVAALAIGGGAHAATAATARASMPVRAKLAIAAAIAVPAIALGVWSVAQPDPHPAVARTVTPPRGEWTTLTRPIDAPSKIALAARIDRARAQRLAKLAAPTRAPVPAAASTPAQPAARFAPDHVITYDFAGSSLFEALPPPQPRTPGPITKRDVRDALHSVQPLLRECYDRTGAHAHGTLQLVVRLEGEPDVGTIATDARLDGEPAFATNAELAECVRETLLAIEMPGLYDGGFVDVYYPFTVPVAER